MRIALVRQRYNPFGGAERFSGCAGEALERRGVEATLIACRGRWLAAARQRLGIYDMAKKLADL